MGRVWKKSGMEKVGFGRVRVYPKFEMSGSGISGIDKLGFGRVRVLKLRVRTSIPGMKKIKSLALNNDFVQFEDKNSLYVV